MNERNVTGYLIDNTNSIVWIEWGVKPKNYKINLYTAIQKACLFIKAPDRYVSVDDFIWPTHENRNKDSLLDFYN